MRRDEETELEAINLMREINVVRKKGLEIISKLKEEGIVTVKDLEEKLNHVVFDLDERFLEQCTHDQQVEKMLNYYHNYYYRIDDSRLNEIGTEEENVRMKKMLNQYILENEILEQLKLESIKYFDDMKLYNDMEFLDSDNENQNVLFVLEKSSFQQEYSIILEEKYDEEKYELIEIVCVLKDVDYYVVNKKIEEITEKLLKQEDRKILFKKPVYSYSNSEYCGETTFVDYTEFNETIYCNCEHCSDYKSYQYEMELEREREREYNDYD